MYLFLQNFSELNFNRFYIFYINILLLHLSPFKVRYLTNYRFYRFFFYTSFIINNLTSQLIKTLKSLIIVNYISNIFSDSKLLFSIFDKFNRTPFPFYTFFFWIERLMNTSYSFIFFQKNWARFNYIFNYSTNVNCFLL